MVVAAVGELQPAETETVFRRVQRGDETGLFGDDHVALQPFLESVAALAQRRADGAIGLVAQVFEARVQLGDELLLTLKCDV